MQDHKLRRIFLAPISPFNILLVGVFSFLWGLWVALPFWDVFNRSPIYSALDWVGSELIWGSIQIIVGTVLVFAAFDSLRWMKYATFGGFLSWFLVALGFAVADWQNPGMWVSGFIAALNAYMFLNTSRRDN